MPDPHNTTAACKDEEEVVSVWREEGPTHTHTHTRTFGLHDVGADTEHLAIGAEGHVGGVEVRHDAGEGLEQGWLARGPQVPQLDTVIHAPGCQGFAIRGKDHGCHLRAVP